MKTGIRILLAAAGFALLAFCGCAGEPIQRPFTILSDLEISFTDSAWNGKTIPAGQQCPAFGGRGATPGLRVQNIPSRANVLILAFSNMSHLPLDNGGAGRIGYRFEPGTQTLTLPPVPGNTFDLPEPFFVIAAHRKPFTNKPGAYLPPCSGGKDNYYYLVVKAVWLPETPDMTPEILGQGKISLGRY